MAEKAKASGRGSKPGERRGGRQLGTPNKLTKDARQAIALFVDANAHRLTGWLDQVADGVLEPGENPEKYAVVPNPAKAFELFQSVVEYHVPKLARTELTGKDGGDIKAAVTLEIFGVAAPKRE